MLACPSWIGPIEFRKELVKWFSAVLSVELIKFLWSYQFLKWTFLSWFKLVSLTVFLRPPMFFVKLFWFGHYQTCVYVLNGIIMIRVQKMKQRGWVDGFQMILLRCQYWESSNVTSHFQRQRMSQNLQLKTVNFPFWVVVGSGHMMRSSLSSRSDGVKHCPLLFCQCRIVIWSKSLFIFLGWIRKSAWFNKGS